MYNIISKLDKLVNGEYVELVGNNTLVIMVTENDDFYFKEIPINIPSVFNANNIPGFSKIHVFEVNNCEVLENVTCLTCKFASFKNCPNLVKIDCHNLYDVFILNCSKLIKTDFQKLTVMKIQNCSNLEIIDCPKLKSLDIRNCPKIKNMNCWNIDFFHQRGCPIFEKEGIYNISDFKKFLIHMLFIYGNPRPLIKSKNPIYKTMGIKTKGPVIYFEKYNSDLLKEFLLGKKRDQ
jgi:hypothetical protein